MNFAIRRARRYGWLDDSMLPNGESLRGIVQSSIRRTFEELDKYDEGKPLLDQLQNRIRQRLSNLAGCSDEKMVKRIANLEMVDIAGNDDASTVDDKDYYDHVLKALAEHPKVKSNPDLELMVFAMGEGVFDPQPMSELTEIDIKRIYELRRTLQTEVYPSVAMSLLSGANNEA